MTDNLTKDAKVDFSYFAVALVDILDQAERLRRITHLPLDQRDPGFTEFIETVKKSYGVINGLRSTFDTFLSAFVKDRPRKTDGLTPNQVELLSRILKIDIKKQQFSDTMIFYTSLANVHDLIPINGVLGLFLALSATLIMAISIGETFRGGMDIGIGSSNCLGSGELYGPVLYQAYELESKKAQYPRIVIGDEMRNYILGEMKVIGEEIEIQYRREIAKKCKEMVCIDLDGLTVLDYLGSSVKEFFIDRGDELRESISKAMTFVSSEYERFKNGRNPELAQRYFMLRYYLRDRINRFWS